MAGRIAVELARRAAGRVTRLVLFGPVGFGDISPARAYVPFVPPLPDALLANLIPRHLVDVIQRRVYGKLGWFTERDIDEYWAPTQFAPVVAAQLQMLREFEWEPHEARALAEFATPTLVVFGTRDRTVRPVHAARLVAAMPHARLQWIAEGGHTVMEEVPNEVNTMLVAFLGGPRSESGATD